MKKIFYILMLVSLASMLLIGSSCSNDDIPEEYIDSKYDMSFKINPQTIVNPLITANLFVHDSGVGNSLYEISGHKVRIRLLVYDTRGILVSVQEKIVGDFRAVSDFTVTLPEGEYRMFSICDLVSENNKEYWTLSGENDITSLKMEKSDIPFGAWGCIVGMNSYSFVLNKLNQDEEIKCDLKPIFVVICQALAKYSNANLLNYLNQKYNVNFSNNYQFDLYTYTYPSFIQFNKDGTYLVSFETNRNNPVSIITRNPNELNFEAGYDYSFAVVLPTSSYVTFGIGIRDSDYQLWELLDELELREMSIGIFYHVVFNPDGRRWSIVPIRENP